MNSVGKKSTIVIGVFICICSLLVAWLIPFNLSRSIDSFNESGDDGEEPTFEGEMMLLGSLFAASFLFGIMLAAYVPALFIFFSCGFSLPFIIKNLKSNSSVIRITNIVHLVIAISFILFALTKIVLFIIGFG